MSISNDGLLLYRGGTDENHQFTWIGREGATIATVGPRNRANYRFDLSPDGKRVAIHRPDDPDTALTTIWVMDLYRGGTLWRFTEPGGQDSDFCPVWDAGGVELVFSRGDDRSMRVLRRPLSGGTPISIVDTKGPKCPTDWSDDGGYVAYNSQEPDYRYQHLWIASMNGESGLFLPPTYYAGSARFAPAVVDGRPRWLAYTSNETGRYEIYIRSFPDAAHMFQISNQGGVMPQWRRDGRELFYLDLNGTLTVVGMDLETAEFGTPDGLFATGLRLTPYNMWRNQYAVATDGQSFLLNRPVEQPEATITAVNGRDRADAHVGFTPDSWVSQGGTERASGWRVAPPSTAYGPGHPRWRHTRRAVVRNRPQGGDREGDNRRTAPPDAPPHPIEVQQSLVYKPRRQGNTNGIIRRPHGFSPARSGWSA